jgi:hypothetical protein
MRSRPSLRHAVPVTLLSVVAAACATNRAPALAPSQMAQLWQRPDDISRRDLYYGPGGRRLAPATGARYTLIETDDKGFSPGYDVRDERGREWSVKLGPEARTEVVVSRIVWAAGYHQPDVYYVPRWSLVDGQGRVTAQQPARFRLERPDRPKDGEWSWRENPFIGTRQFAGLFTLMILVNNWDIKTSQNAVYRLGGDDAPRHYVVRDLGASLGRTSWFFPGVRDDVEAFEREPFIHSVQGNRVRFHYRGAWLEPQLNTIVTPDDVVWICQLLAQLTPQQWMDAFRAGGYSEAEASRFIRRLREKIDDGLQLRARA